MNATPRPLTPGENPVSTVREAGCAPGPIWTGVENHVPNRVSDSETSSPYRDSIPTQLSRAADLFRPQHLIVGLI